MQFCQFLPTILRKISAAFISDVVFGFVEGKLQRSISRRPFQGAAARWMHPWGDTWQLSESGLSYIEWGTGVRRKGFQPAAGIPCCRWHCALSASKRTQWKPEFSLLWLLMHIDGLQDKGQFFCYGLLEVYILEHIRSSKEPTSSDWLSLKAASIRSTLFRFIWLTILISNSQ
jgi:hypothetical protein